MALHHQLPIHRTGSELLGLVARIHAQMPRGFKRTRNDALHRVATIPASDLFEVANSYLGLLGQASHGHADQARLANIILSRGHCVSGDLSKCYRRNTA